MRKIFGCLLYLLINIFPYSQEINWSPYNPEYAESSIIYSDDDVYCYYLISTPWIRIYLKNLSYEEGYVKSIIEYKHPIDRRYVLEGKNIIIFETYYFFYDWEKMESNKESTYNSFLTEPISLSEWHDRKYNRTENHITKEGWNRITLYEDGIKNISASSFLEEKNRDGTSVVYSAENIKDTLFYLTGDGTVDLLYDNLTPPWVEGVEGYGVGEYLDIEFDYASDEIQILNGFVDFSRMHLYKDNSRVKRIRIDSENPSFSQEYELEDIVRYNLIQLPQPTDKIRMTILDVYPGRRWQDTCLSSILVTNPDQTPYEEQKEKIITLMKENGVWDQIEEFKRENGL